MSRRTFYALLVTGLVVRMFVLWHTATLDTMIVDEQQFRQIAETVLHGQGFGWGPEQLTSIRPPLYPAVLASVWWLFGEDNLQAVRVLQQVMSLITVGIVYLIGARAFSVSTGRIAAVICWLYPSLIFSSVLILTETLFTLMLVAFLLAALALLQSPRPTLALACGALLGLGALTRSILWPLPVLLCPLLLVLMQDNLKRRLTLTALLLVGYVAVVGPWAVRNTRLQQVVTIVDTMGGINLRQGNYEYTLEDRMWDTVSLRGDQNWVHGFETDPPGLPPTEGRKDKWAQRKAIEYMAAHPLTTARRSLIKFADFWGLEREFIAGVQAGLFTPPRWMQITATAAIVLGYAALALAGTAGIWLTAPRDWRVHVLLLLPVVLIMAGHTIVFAHSRYHLPLMPILGLYAAQLIVVRPSVGAVSRPVLSGAALSVCVLGVIWARQILFVDLARLTAVLERIV